MADEIVDELEKSSKSTSEKIAEVDALLSIVPEIGVTRACRKIGMPKETYYWHKRKRRAESSDMKLDSRQSEGGRHE